MEAVCRGAAEGGGRSLGLIVGAGEANRFVTDVAREATDQRQRGAVAGKDPRDEQVVSPLRRELGELTHEPQSDTSPLPRVLDGVRDLGRPPTRLVGLLELVVPGDGDDLVAVEGRKGFTARVVDIREVLQHRLRQSRNRREEPEVDALG